FVRDDNKLKNPYSVFVSGSYAYVASSDANSLTVVDVSNPASPVIKGSVQDDKKLRGPYSVFVSGNYGYVTSYGFNRLTVVDVSNPASPVIKGFVRDDNKLKNPYSVFVSGNYAYVASYNANSLTVVDVFDPASPVIKGSVTDAKLDGARSVFVSGSYAYVASSDANSLTVVDVSNPASPALIVGGSGGSVQDATMLGGVDSVFVSGSHAYVTSYGGNRLTVVDVSKPDSPNIVNSLQDATMLNGARSVFVSGNYAYVASYLANSLVVVDVSDPAQPSPVYASKRACGELAAGQTCQKSWTIVGTGAEGDSKQFYAKADSAAPYSLSSETPNHKKAFIAKKIVGSITDAKLDDASSVFVSGSHAYVTAQSDKRLTVVDVSNPASPGIIGDVQVSHDARSVQVSGDYAYVAAGRIGWLSVVDVSKPAGPVTKSSFRYTQLGGFTFSVFVSGSHAYATGTFTFIVVDANPGSLRKVYDSGLKRDFAGASSIYVSGDYAYVTSDYDDGLLVVDVSTPSSPAPVTSVQDGTKLLDPSSVFVKDSFAYITAPGSNRFTVVDVSTPSDPKLIVGGTGGSVEDATLLGGTSSVYVSGDYAYVTSYAANSLAIVDVSTPASPKIVGSIQDAAKLSSASSVFVVGDYAFVQSSYGYVLTIVDWGCVLYC
ncbi:MAG: hypothetical protein AABX69_04545, partial [Nanoarchaeota archaeon]